MPVTLSGTTIKGLISTHATNIDTSENSPGELGLTKNVEIALAAGDGLGQANEVWAQTDTIAAGGAGVWDIVLHGTVLNAFGDVVNFLKVKVILIYNHAGDGDPEVIIGNEGTAAEFDTWVGTPTDSVRLPAGGLFLLACPGNAANNGYDTDGGAEDVLSILNTHATKTATVDAVIIGCVT